MNLTLTVILTSILLCVCRVAYSQQMEDRKMNAIYVELTTHLPAYTINYDRVFSNKKSLAYSYRVGFSVTKEALYFPIGINLITGTKSSHAEFSLVTAAYIKGHDTFPTNLQNSDTYLYIIPGFGYRYQRKNAGPFFKVVASPELRLDPPSDDFWNMRYKFYGSFFFSMGYSF